MKIKKKIIMGIDPGFNITGLSILEIKNNKLNILYIKEINLKKEKNYLNKMNIIYLKIKKIIKLYNPNILVMESTFLGKNVKSLKRLIQCQSSIIFAAIHKKLSIIEYSPKTIKLLITGYGNSTKKDLKKKLEKIFNKKLNYSKNFDFSDSLGVALCYIINIYKYKIKLN
ncbi:MAG: crossover junction endodeoxyribonuclease RuvC [Candidatus Shikimatogenerans bostrichidophilus]|nr:MAG: crossover junction endodeoxyribonuclease RuvC [Candidatus Shikimatogenerans bostrichidophilus]